MNTVRLHRIAHARAGDKGNTSSISVVAFDEAGWELICKELTVDRVAHAFQAFTQAHITRFELPLLHALNFVLPGALAGGVTRSLALDAHGKSLSYLMLDIELPFNPTSFKDPT